MVSTVIREYKGKDSKIVYISTRSGLATSPVCATRRAWPYREVGSGPEYPM